MSVIMQPAFQTFQESHESFGDMEMELMQNMVNVAMCLILASTAMIFERTFGCTHKIENRCKTSCGRCDSATCYDHLDKAALAFATGTFELSGERSDSMRQDLLKKLAKETQMDTLPPVQLSEENEVVDEDTLPPAALSEEDETVQEETVPSFTLKERVRFEGVKDGWTLPLCGKPALVKLFHSRPALLPSFVNKALEEKTGKLLIFIADGEPMAQQIGSFVSASLNNTRKQVHAACEELERLARAVVADLSPEDQSRIEFVRWNDLLPKAEYEEWYQFIMNNEETRAVVEQVALDIIKYRVDAFSKKGLKCARFFDEEGKLLTRAKTQKRYGWTQESIAREITTLIWGFKLESGTYRAPLYMTPNSTGMDLISGGAQQIYKILAAQNLRDDLPEFAALYYYDLTLN